MLVPVFVSPSKITQRKLDREMSKPMPQQDATKKVSRDELARLLKVSRYAIDHAIRNGFIETDEDGLLDFQISCQRMKIDD